MASTSELLQVHHLLQFTGRKDKFMGKTDFFFQTGDNLIDWLTHMYIFHNSELSLELPKVNSNSVWIRWSFQRKVFLGKMYVLAPTVQG